jgi:hypothetical protein
MNDSDRVLLRVVADCVQALARHQLLLEKGALRSANLGTADLEQFGLRIAGALGDPSTGLATLATLVEDLTHARAQAARLR